MRAVVLIALFVAAAAALAYVHQEDVLYLARLASDRVPCPAQTDRTLVAVTFGQSNAANTAEYRHRAGPTVLNFYDGQCFRARDPLLGAQGLKGSVWSLMGDALTGDPVAPRYDYVILAPAAVGGTRLAQWNGELAGRLDERLSALKASGYRVTHFLWHQGESDAGATPAAQYAAALKALISRVQHDFPAAGFWVAQASLCGASADAEIRRAQREVTNSKIRIYPGPNTDLIPREERFDGCHLARRGQERAAAMWAQAINP